MDFRLTFLNRPAGGLHAWAIILAVACQGVHCLQLGRRVHERRLSQTDQPLMKSPAPTERSRSAQGILSASALSSKFNLTAMSGKRAVPEKCRRELATHPWQSREAPG